MILSFLFFSGCTAWNAYLPRPGIEPTPLQQKHRVLTPGPPGKSKMTLKWVNMRTSLVVWWLRIYLPVQVTWLWPLVGGTKILHTLEQLSPHMATTEPACTGAQNPQQRLSVAKIRIVKNKLKKMGKHKSWNHLESRETHKLGTIT